MPQDFRVFQDGMRARNKKDKGVNLIPSLENVKVIEFRKCYWKTFAFLVNRKAYKGYPGKTIKVQKTNHAIFLVVVFLPKKIASIVFSFTLIVFPVYPSHILV